MAKATVSFRRFGVGHDPEIVEVCSSARVPGCDVNFRGYFGFRYSQYFTFIKV